MSREIRKVWLTLGVLASSISVISFIQHFFSIGLAPIMRNIILFYKYMLYPIFDLFEQILHVAIPDWYRDVFVVSLVFSTTLARVLIMMYINETSSIVWPKPSIRIVVIYRYIVVLLQSTSLIGCVLPILYLHTYLSIRKHIVRAKKELADYMKTDQHRYMWGNNPDRKPNWKENWLLDGYALAAYEFIKLYSIYLMCMTVIAVVFYAINSM